MLIKKIGTFIVTFLFVLLASNSTFADEKTNIVDFENNKESSIHLPNGLSLIVNNAENSSYVIEQGSDVLYEETIPFGWIEKVHKTEDYVVIESRLTGSGSYLSFDVFKLTADGVIDVHHSDDYMMGQLDINGDDVTVSIPKYSGNDSMADPSKVIVKKYRLDGDFTLVKEFEENLKPDFSIQSEETTGKNPSPDKINAMLTEAAIKNGIPPEVLKAIAWAESGWDHFWPADNTNAKECQNGNAGETKIGFDCIGIGIMQVSDYRSMPEDTDEQKSEKETYIKRLKEDINFNIQEGVNILLDKWDNVNAKDKYVTPMINDGSMDKMEHWYFAIIAYNGRSKINDPRISSAERIENKWPSETYQDKIYRFMKEKSLLSVQTVPTKDLDISYEKDSNVMYFTNKLNYKIADPLTETKHLFTVGQVLPTTTNVNFRSAPDGKAIGELAKADPVLLTGPRQYSTLKNNHFVWYPVKTKEGRAGFVASSYLDKKISYFDLSETSNNSRGYEEVAMLSGQGIINGFNDGTFRPKEPLKRLQAALMFVRALDIETPNVSDTGFTDIKVGDNFYKEIAAAKKAGIFKGSGGKFNKNDKLTRSEMAAVLVRAFKIIGESDKEFSDVPKGHQFESAIQTLYENNITRGLNEKEYGFHEEIIRVDFSILLYKTIQEAESQQG